MTLQEFFGAHPKAALAFSGGVDSSYLLYAARQLGADVKAYYVKTAFQPEFEYQDALRLASQLGADIQVLTLDVLACPDVTVNMAVGMGDPVGMEIGMVMLVVMRMLVVMVVGMVLVVVM